MKQNYDDGLPKPSNQLAFDNIADLFFESAEDPRFRLPHGSGRNTEFGGHHRGQLVFDDSPPEHLPRLVLEFGPDEFQSAGV